jgi:outer membrane protein assembly factor BamB
VLPLPDRDGDGVGDLLVVRGGGYDDSHRVPGELVEVSGARGVVLRRHALPDGAETYAVPAGLPGGEWIVATGGLEQPGHLQRLGPRGTPRWSFPSGPSGGFIGSPVVYAGPQRRPWVADIAFWGTVVALDAGDGTVRWRRRLEGLQTEASPAAGAFGGDATPDIVVVASRGRFPVYEEAQVVWLDGRTGEVLGRRPIGKVAVSTPLAFDLDGDGLDETLVLANDRFDQVTGHATMLLFDGRRREVLARWGGLGFAAATPALARLSDGGPWSLVVVTQGQVWRLDLKGRVRPSWPAFRGPTGDGGHGSVRGLGSERPSVRPAGGAGPP